MSLLSEAEIYAWKMNPVTKAVKLEIAQEIEALTEAVIYHASRNEPEANYMAVQVVTLKDLLNKLNDIRTTIDE